MRTGGSRGRHGVALLVVVAAAAMAVAAAPGGRGQPGLLTVPRQPGPTILALDGVVTRPDGSTVDTGVDVGVGGFGVLADRRVVVEAGSDGSGPREIRVYAADGGLEQTHPSAPEGMLATRTAVAWAGADGRLRVLHSGEPEPVVLAAAPRSERDAAKGIRGFELVAVDCDGAAPECAVVTYYDSLSTTLPPGIRRSVSVRVEVDGWEALGRRDLVPRSVRTSPDGATMLVPQPDYCVALRDVTEGEDIARTCVVSALSYSPSGGRVAGVSNDGIHVFERDLRGRRTIALPGGLVHLAHAWADDDSLLVVMMGEDEVVPDPDPGGDRPGGGYDWYLLDVPIDGSEATVRQGPVVGPHYDTNQWPWRLHDG